MGPINLSRRTILVGFATVAVAAGAGVMSLSDRGHIRRTLKRLVGPFKMSDEDFNAFVADFRAAEQAPSYLKASVLRSLELIGMGPTISKSGVSKLADHQIEFERSLLTAFVTRTDYTFFEHPEAETITYLGSMTVCLNPFANFD